jgi:hypothetical protein
VAAENERQKQPHFRASSPEVSVTLYSRRSKQWHFYELARTSFLSPVRAAFNKKRKPMKPSTRGGILIIRRRAITIGAQQTF